MAIKEKLENNMKEDVKEESNIIKKFGKNVFTSVISLLLIKFLGFIYRALLFNIKGYTDEANGYYSAGYELYALILAVIATGIPNIISRLTAEKIGENKKEDAKRIFNVSLKFFGLVSILASILLYIFADQIATNIYTIPNIALVIKVLAPAIFFVSTSAIIRGHFIGIGNVTPSNSAQLLEQLLNCSLTILFAYIASGRAPHIIAAAANISTTIAAILSFTYLVIYLFKTKESHDIKIKFFEKDNIEKKKNKEILKEILKITIPITIGTFIGVFNLFIDSVTVSRGMQEALKGTIENAEILKSKAIEANGLISKVNMIVTAPQVLSQAFANILITSVAFYTAKKQMDKAGENITQSLKVLLILLFPAMVGIITLASPILKIVFPLAPAGEKILMMYSVVGFFVSFNMVLNSALNGLGKVKIPPIIILISAVIKLILNIILIPIPSINIYGSPISSLTSQGIIFVITYFILRKYVKMNFGGIKYFIKVVFASLIMGASAYYINKFLNIYMSDRIAGIIAIVFSIIIYALCILVFKAADKEMLEKIPGLNKFVNKNKKIK